MDEYLILSAVFALLLVVYAATRSVRKMSKKRRKRRGMDTMNGPEFEQYCAYLLRKHGFRKVKVSGKSGDQGVDIIAYKRGKKYAIQCKCYSRPLGNKPVQEINAGMEMVKAHVGVVMTNSTFTKGAVECAKGAGRDKPILLWDGMYLRKNFGAR